MSSNTRYLQANRGLLCYHQGPMSKKGTEFELTTCRRKRNMLMRYRISITLGVIFSTGLLWCTPVRTTQPDRPAHEILLDKCREIETKSAKGTYGFPIFIKSAEEGDTFRGEVYGIFENPFKTVRDAITAPRNWCDMVSVHYNIKAWLVHGEGLRTNISSRFTADQRPTRLLKMLISWTLTSGSSNIRRHTSSFF